MHSILDRSRQRDGTPPEFDAAIVDLRRLLAASRADPDQHPDMPALIERLARVGRAEGMKAETVVVAFRIAWLQEVSDPSHALSEAWDAKRYRAIGRLLNAYFTDQRNDA